MPVLHKREDSDQRRHYPTSNLDIHWQPSEHATFVQRLPDVVQTSTTFRQRKVDVVLTSRVHWENLTSAVVESVFGKAGYNGVHNRGVHSFSHKGGNKGVEKVTLSTL